MPSGSERVPDVFDGLTWVDIDSPVTRGWWQSNAMANAWCCCSHSRVGLPRSPTLSEQSCQASRCLACQLAIGWLSPSRIKVAFTDEKLRSSGRCWIGSASSAVVDAMDANRGLLNLE